MDTDLHKGMKRRAPAGTDKSMTPPPGGGVNQDACRSGVAKSPRTLGPRTA